MFRAFRLGITGKIGSGKSTLSRIAREHGIHVLDADTIAKQVMNSNAEVRRKIESLFGKESYVNGELNRSFLASKIFSDEKLRVQLEKIVHPATLHVFTSEFQKGKPGEIIAMESAILFQTELDEKFDAVILVDARDEYVTERLVTSKKFSKEDIANRLKEQHYKNEWKEDADFVISNDGSEKEFIERCESLIELIKIVAQQNLPEEPLRMIVE
jgi:dephospho-CoA kinase